LNVITNGGKILVRLLLHPLQGLQELQELLLHLLLGFLELLLHLLLGLLELLLHLLLGLLELLLGLLKLLKLLLRLLLGLLHLLLELLLLLHKSIALSERGKVGKISYLCGSLLESLSEEWEIRLWAELSHRLRRINVCHGFKSQNYGSAK
jgi:hypothetical protein